MPTYIRPRRAIIETGGPDAGALVLAAAGVAVVVFVAGHLVLLAVCGGVFVAVLGAFTGWCRWTAAPGDCSSTYSGPP